MTQNVFLTYRAIQGIREAAGWWATHRNAGEAARWYEGIMSALRQLSDNPQGHPLADLDLESDDELREMLYGSGSRPTHRVFFAVRSNDIHVLAVRHVARGNPNPEELME